MTSMISLYAGKSLPVPDNFFVRNMSKELVWSKSVGNKGCVVSDIGAGISGLLRADNKWSMMFGIQPNVFVKGAEYVVKPLQNIFETILKRGGDAWGFICGGFNGVQTNNRTVECSYEMYNRVAECFDTMGIPFGMICGKNSPDHFDSIKVHKNDILMGGDYINANLAQSENQIITVDAIKALYADVDIPEWMECNPFIINNPNLG